MTILSRGFRYGCILFLADLCVSAFFFATERLFGVSWWGTGLYELFAIFDAVPSAVALWIVHLLGLPTAFHPTPRIEQIVIVAIELFVSVVWWLLVGLIVACARAVLTKRRQTQQSA